MAETLQTPPSEVEHTDILDTPEATTVLMVADRIVQKHFAALAISSGLEGAENREDLSSTEITRLGNTAARYTIHEILTGELR